MTTQISPPGAEDLRAYLFRLAEQLNVALAALDAPAPAQGNGAPASGGEYSALRSLIANTADTVRTELAETAGGLRADYAALSQSFGAFTETITDNIEVAAGAAVRTLGYDAAIEALSAGQAGIEDYRVRTEGFIRQGFIDYDELGVPIVGIAIGKGLTATEVTVGGEKYTRFDTNQSCAFYTADRVSFRLNGREAAYISNSRFCMAEGAVTGSFAVGPWRLDPARGLAVRWTGE